MADPARFRYMDSAGRRSPPLYNPARSSMPVTGGGYSSLYSGDLHAMSASHHEGLSRPADEYRTSAVPVSTTTYAVRKEPLSRSTSVNDGTRVHRVLDHTSKRPIIVTTKHHPSGPRSGSPARDPYRSSDEGQYYAQPASSIPRSRAAGHVPSSVAMDEEEYRRLKERTHHDRLGKRGADPYRSPPSGPLYAGPNHRPSTYGYDEEGYEYTKPSDLARYDLDHDQRHKTRRESLDRYYRPTVSISTDLARPFDQPDRRARGPPPTTRGLEKIGWGQTAGGIYDGAGSRMPLPPSVPLIPDVRHSGLIETPRSPREEHRGGPRPLSMIQDDPARHHDDYYYDDPRDQQYFHDDRVTTRGFGILVDPNDVDDPRRPQERAYQDEPRERRGKRYEGRESRRRSDDDLEIIRHEYDDRDHRRRRERDYVVYDEGEKSRKDRRSDDDDDDDDGGDDGKGDNESSSRRGKIRDKAATGLGLAAATVGLKSAMKRRDDKTEDSSPPRKHADEEAGRRDREEVDSRDKPSRKEPLLGDEEFEIVEHPRDREKQQRPEELVAEIRDSKKDDDVAAPSQRSRDQSSSMDDESKTKPRRRVRASSFNPNDTAALAEMKARLAELRVSDKDTPQRDERSDDKEVPPAKEPAREPSPERKPVPVERPEADPDASALVPRDSGDERDPPPRDEKQVRLVPPPKEPVVEKKPIKGILKQPRAQFPEEPNPVREGVAPHKDDKSKSNVPPGARWTKISRKMVNPEALKIGKERFEVRDDFVIVLRVLSKEEIQAYAAATATLRERRKKEYEREMRGEAEYDEERDRNRDRDREDGEDDDKRKRHRQHHRDKDDDRRTRDRDRDRERDREDRDRNRRHRRETDVIENDEEYETRRHHRVHRD